MNLIIGGQIPTANLIYVSPIYYGGLFLYGIFLLKYFSLYTTLAASTSRSTYIYNVLNMRVVGICTVVV